MTSKELFLAAANFLEQHPDRWGRGDFFRRSTSKTDPCLMCVHGLIGFLVDPQIALHADNGDTISAMQEFCKFETQYSFSKLMKEYGLTYLFNDTAKNVSEIITKLREIAEKV